MKRILMIGLVLLLAWLVWAVWIDGRFGVDPIARPASSGHESEPEQDPNLTPPVNPPPAPIPGMPRNSLPIAAAPEAAAGARLLIVRPQDGATVSSPFTLEANLVGMRLVPAGVDESNTGHLHVLVDASSAISSGPITSDPHHIDFGSGESAGELDLPAGRHTLQLLLGDGSHVPHETPVISAQISVTVEAN